MVPVFYCYFTAIIAIQYTEYYKIEKQNKQIQKRESNKRKRNPTKLKQNTQFQIQHKHTLLTL